MCNWGRFPLHIFVFKKGMNFKMKIGIDVGGSHIAIGAVDENGKIIEKTEKRLTNKEKQNIEQSIENYIVEHAKQFIEKYNAIEMGISIAGINKDGYIFSSGNIGITNYPMAEKLSKEIHIPIKIRNDAKCAGLAEQEYGCLKGYTRSIFLTLGTGIGGVIFLDGKPVTVEKKTGYEIGHMIIQKDGIPCHCGKNGCFERYASMKVFKNNLRKALNFDETVSGEQLLEILRNNNIENENYTIIEDVIETFIEDLSIGISNLVSIFEPEIIGIGGSFVHFAEILLPRLMQKMKEQGRDDIIFQTAVFGNDAGIIGSIL